MIEIPIDINLGLFEDAVDKVEMLQDAMGRVDVSKMMEGSEKTRKAIIDFCDEAQKAIDGITPTEKEFSAHAKMASYIKACREEAMKMSDVRLDGVRSYIKGVVEDFRDVGKELAQIDRQMNEILSQKGSSAKNDGAFMFLEAKKRALQTLSAEGKDGVELSLNFKMDGFRPFEQRISEIQANPVELRIEIPKENITDQYNEVRDAFGKKSADFFKFLKETDISSLEKQINDLFDKRSEVASGSDEWKKVMTQIQEKEKLRSSYYSAMDAYNEGYDGFENFKDIKKPLSSMPKRGVVIDDVPEYVVERETSILPKDVKAKEPAEAPKKPNETPPSDLLEKVVREVFSIDTKAIEREVERAYNERQKSALTANPQKVRELEALRATDKHAYDEEVVKRDRAYYARTEEFKGAVSKEMAVGQIQEALRLGHTSDEELQHYWDWIQRIKESHGELPKGIEKTEEEWVKLANEFRQTERVETPQIIDALDPDEIVKGRMAFQPIVKDFDSLIERVREFNNVKAANIDGNSTTADINAFLDEKNGLDDDFSLLKEVAAKEGDAFGTEYGRRLLDDLRAELEKSDVITESIGEKLSKGEIGDDTALKNYIKEYEGNLELIRVQKNKTIEDIQDLEDYVGNQKKLPIGEIDEEKVKNTEAKIEFLKKKVQELDKAAESAAGEEGVENAYKRIDAKIEAQQKRVDKINYFALEAARNLDPTTMKEGEASAAKDSGGFLGKRAAEAMQLQKQIETRLANGQTVEESELRTLEATFHAIHGLFSQEQFDLDMKERIANAEREATSQAKKSGKAIQEAIEEMGGDASKASSLMKTDMLEYLPKDLKDAAQKITSAVGTVSKETEKPFDSVSGVNAYRDAASDIKEYNGNIAEDAKKRSAVVKVEIDEEKSNLDALMEKYKSLQGEYRKTAAYQGVDPQKLRDQLKDLYAERDNLVNTNDEKGSNNRSINETEKRIADIKKQLEDLGGLRSVESIEREIQETQKAIVSTVGNVENLCKTQKALVDVQTNAEIAQRALTYSQKNYAEQSTAILGLEAKSTRELLDKTNKVEELAKAYDSANEKFNSKKGTPESKEAAAEVATTFNSMSQNAKLSSIAVDEAISRQSSYVKALSDDLSTLEEKQKKAFVDGGNVSEYTKKVIETQKLLAAAKKDLEELSAKKVEIESTKNFSTSLMSERSAKVYASDAVKAYNGMSRAEQVAGFTNGNQATARIDKAVETQKSAISLLEENVQRYTAARNRMLSSGDMSGADAMTAKIDETAKHIEAAKVELEKYEDAKAKMTGTNITTNFGGMSNDVSVLELNVRKLADVMNKSIDSNTIGEYAEISDAIADASKNIGQSVKERSETIGKELEEEKNKLQTLVTEYEAAKKVLDEKTVGGNADEIVSAQTDFNDKSAALVQQSELVRQLEGEQRGLAQAQELVTQSQNAMNAAQEKYASNVVAVAEAESTRYESFVKSGASLDEMIRKYNEMKAQLAATPKDSVGYDELAQKVKSSYEEIQSSVNANVTAFNNAIEAQKKIVESLGNTIKDYKEKLDTAILSGNTELAAQISAQITDTERKFTEAQAKIESLSQRKLNMTSAIDGTTLSLQNTKKAVQEVSNDADRLYQKLHNNAEGLAQMNNAAYGLRGTFQSLVGMAGAGFVFGSGLQMVNDIKNTRTQFQMLEMSFNTLLQSEEKAGRLMDELVNTAKVTPFGLNEVSDAAKQLMAYGISADKVNDTIVRLGDLAAGLGTNVGSIAYLYGTTVSKPKMDTMDYKQFKGRGIPIDEAIAEVMGKAVSEVPSLISKGQVTGEIVDKAVTKLTTGDGMFAGMMVNQSKSIGGQISNIEDQISMVFNDLGKKAEPMITGFLEFVGNALEHTKSIGAAILGVVGAMKSWQMVSAASKAIEEKKAQWTENNYKRELENLNKKIALQEQANGNKQKNATSGLDNDLQEAVEKGYVKKDDAELINKKRKEWEKLTKAQNDNTDSLNRNTQARQDAINGTVSGNVDTQDVVNVDTPDIDETPENNENASSNESLAEAIRNRAEATRESTEATRENTEANSGGESGAEEKEEEASAIEEVTSALEDNLETLEEEEEQTQANTEQQQVNNVVTEGSALANEGQAVSAEAAAAAEGVHTAETEVDTAATELNSVAQGTNSASLTGNTNAENVNTTATSGNAAAQTRNTTAENQNTGAVGGNTAAVTTNSLALKAGSLVKAAYAKTTLFLKSAVDQAKLSLQAMWASMAANPIGLVISAITMAIGLFTSYKMRMEENTSAVDEANKKADEQRKKLEEQMATLRAAPKNTKLYNDSLRDLIKSCEDYGVAIDENKLRSEDEAVRTAELAKAHDGLAEAYKREAEAKIQAATLEEKYEAQKAEADKFGNSIQTFFDNNKMKLGIDEEQAKEMGDWVSSMMKQRMGELAGLDGEEYAKKFQEMLVETIRNSGFDDYKEEVAKKVKFYDTSYSVDQETGQKIETRTKDIVLANTKMAAEAYNRQGEAAAKLAENIQKVNDKKAEEARATERANKIKSGSIEDLIDMYNQERFAAQEAERAGNHSAPSKPSKNVSADRGSNSSVEENTSATEDNTNAKNANTEAKNANAEATKNANEATGNNTANKDANTESTDANTDSKNANAESNSANSKSLDDNIASLNEQQFAQEESEKMQTQLAEAISQLTTGLDEQTAALVEEQIQTALATGNSKALQAELWNLLVASNGASGGLVNAGISADSLGASASGAKANTDSLGNSLSNVEGTYNIGFQEQGFSEVASAITHLIKLLNEISDKKINLPKFEGISGVFSSTQKFFKKTVTRSKGVNNGGNNGGKGGGKSSDSQDIKNLEADVLKEAQATYEAELRKSNMFKSGEAYGSEAAKSQLKKNLQEQMAKLNPYNKEHQRQYAKMQALIQDLDGHSFKSGKGGSGGKKSGRGGKSGGRGASEAQKLAEQRNRESVENEKKSWDALMQYVKDTREEEDKRLQLREMEIELMEEGYEKTLAQLKLEQERKVLDVERNRMDEKYAIIEKARAEFNEEENRKASKAGKGKYTKKVFDESKLGEEFKTDIREIDQYFDKELKLTLKLNTKEAKEQFKEYLEDTYSDQIDYYEKFGSYTEKMQALQMQKAIELAKPDLNEWQIKSIEKNFETNAKELAKEAYEEFSGLSQMLDNLSHYNVQALDKMSSSLEDILNNNEDWTADGIQRYKELHEALMNIYEARADLDPIGSWKNAKKKLDDAKQDLEDFKKELQSVGEQVKMEKEEQLNIDMMTDEQLANSMKLITERANLSNDDALKAKTAEDVEDMLAEQRMRQIEKEFKDYIELAKSFGAEIDIPIDFNFRNTQAVQDKIQELTNTDLETGRLIDPNIVKVLTNDEKKLLELLKQVYEIPEYNDKLVASTFTETEQTLWDAYQNAKTGAEQMEVLSRTCLDGNGNVVKFGDQLKKLGILENNVAKAENGMATANTKLSEKWQKFSATLRKGISIIGDVGAQLADLGKNRIGMVVSAIGDLGQSVLDGIDSIQDVVFSSENAIKGSMAASIKAMSAMEKASFILTIISVAFQVASKIFNLVKDMHNDALQKDIDELNRKIEDLQETYTDLETAVGKAFSKEQSNLILQQSRNIEAQNKLIRQQIEDEKQMKGESEEERLDKIRGYEKTIRDNERQLKELKESAKDAIWGTDIQSAIQSFADAYTTAITDGQSFTRSAKELAVNMLRTMITTAMNTDISRFMGIMRDKMNAFMGDGMVTAEEQADLENAFAAQAEQMHEKWQWADGILKGKTLTEGASSGGFEAMSQDSADELNGRFAALQMSGETIGQYSILNNEGLTLLNATAAQIASAMDSTNPNGSFTRLLEIQANALVELQGINTHTADTVYAVQRMETSLEQLNTRLRNL